MITIGIFECKEGHGYSCHKGTNLGEKPFSNCDSKYIYRVVFKKGSDLIESNLFARDIVRLLDKKAISKRELENYFNEKGAIEFDCLI